MKDREDVCPLPFRWASVESKIFQRLISKNSKPSTWTKEFHMHIKWSINPKNQLKMYIKQVMVSFTFTHKLWDLIT